MLTRTQLGETNWTLWDRFEFRGNPTLAEIVDWFKKNHGLDVNMASQGVVMLWSPFIGKAKVRKPIELPYNANTHDPPQSQERMKMRLSDLVEMIGKKPLPPNTTHLVVEMLCSDQEGEDVDVSILLYFMIFDS